MIFELWSRRRNWPKWEPYDTLWQSLPQETREAIDSDVKATLAARKYHVRFAIWTRTGPNWQPCFLWHRKKSRLISQAGGRLEYAAQWRKHPKRGGIRLLRSKGWGARSCPHFFGRDCLSSWKSWLIGDGVRIVTSLAGKSNVAGDGAETQ